MLYEIIGGVTGALVTFTWCQILNFDMNRHDEFFYSGKFFVFAGTLVGVLVC